MIKVFKFGGASVKDAAAIRNVSEILRTQAESRSVLLVVSAMGKTTNALEAVYDLAYQNADPAPALDEVKAYHYQIITDLFPDQTHLIYGQINTLFQQLEAYIAQINPTEAYDLQYDQVVSYGELLASVILHAYLHQQQATTQWLDCRSVIRTDSTWREGKVEWEQTERLIQINILPLLRQGHVITQGFLGGTTGNYTTTLGREGSDYTAAIFAYCLPATSVTIWKDVAGLLNADPKLFAETVLYEEISYQETVEMAYYGASVIHPKTIKPLANKNIPLRVKSFLNPTAAGTIIHNCHHQKIAPAYIVKQNQCLLSFQEKDFAFVNENNLSAIFATLAQHRFKINLMQNSALSFSVCTDYHESRLQNLIAMLRDSFTVHYNTGLTLYTIKNYDETSITTLTQDKVIMLEQRSRTTFQLVSKT